MERTHGNTQTPYQRQRVEGGQDDGRSPEHDKGAQAQNDHCRLVLYVLPLSRNGRAKVSW